MLEAELLRVVPLPLRAFALSARQEATEGREDGSEDGSEDQGQENHPERITGRSMGFCVGFSLSVFGLHRRRHQRHRVGPIQEIVRE